MQYVTLDDIMDLMGSDAVQGEEALRKMWKDSVNDCNCSAARITYDDFVLIMKGQTRDFETEGQGVPRSDSGQRLNGALMHAVNEVDEAESKAAGGTPQSIKNISGFSPHFNPDETDLLDMDSPLSMDNIDGMPMTSQLPDLPAFPPPITPNRANLSESDIPVPLSPVNEPTLHSTSSDPDFYDAHLMPQIPKPSVIHVRGKSRSFDEREMKTSFDIDSRRAVALPEHDPEKKKAFANDKQMSALQVNRQLYRSHRQMRLSVIDACKRFEEQQTKHAHGLLLAEKNKKSNLGAFAGLVMRRVENKTVSSEEVKNLLEKNRKEQQDLMDKANRRSGGRRSRRKKTVSDLSTMMGSLSSEEMTKATANQGLRAMIPPVIETKPLELELSDDDTNFRQATVPGQFRKVKDPFGSHGKYAAIMSSN
jgi:hypothetical protein